MANNIIWRFFFLLLLHIHGLKRIQKTSYTRKFAQLSFFVQEKNDRMCWCMRNSDLNQVLIENVGDEKRNRISPTSSNYCSLNIVVLFNCEIANYQTDPWFTPRGHGFPALLNTLLYKWGNDVGQNCRGLRMIKTKRNWLVLRL